VSTRFRDPPPTGALSRRSVLAAGAVLASAAVAPAIAAGRKGNATDNIRVGDTVDRTNPEVASEVFFLQRLGELTGGRVRGNTYPSGVLGSHDRMNEQLRNGTLEFAKTSVANLEVYDKRMGIFALPYAFADRRSLYAAQDGGLGTELGGILAQHDLKLLCWFDSGERHLYNTVRPVHTPDDLRGLKVRIQQNEIMIDTFNTLGAQSTPLDTNQIYSALQQGVVQGAENSVTFYVQQHHNEVAKFFSYTRHFFSVDPLLASARWFRSQDASVQDAIMTAAHETQARERSLWLASDDRYRGVAQQTGSTLNDTDVEAFRQAVRGVYAKHRARFGNLLRYTDFG
jgi:tripartite ATP-independent transporter DctP family solute receptor